MGPLCLYLLDLSATIVNSFMCFQTMTSARFIKKYNQVRILVYAFLKVKMRKENSKQKHHIMYLSQIKGVDITGQSILCE